MMQRVLMMTLCSCLILSAAVSARTVEIEVHGMTCAFCVDSLERKFTQMKSVSQVLVSLKFKKIRLVTEDKLPTIETIKQTVLDAGFTPVKINLLTNDEEQR